VRGLLIAQQPGTQIVITRPAAQAVAAALLANGMVNTERTKAAIAEQRKFSALLKMLRAGVT